MAVEFFAKAGFPCPSRRNPSDHFLRCVNSDFDKVTTLMGSQRIQDTQVLSDNLKNTPTAEIKANLVESFRCSDYAKRARTRVQEISNIQGLRIVRKSGSQATWRKQLSTLTKRSFVNMSRDAGYYWLRIAVYLALSICVGTVFFDVGTRFRAIVARRACGGFISGFMTFMSIGGFPSFLEEMKVFHRERLGGHYGVAVYILSNFLSSFPLLAFMSFSTCTIIYYMVKFRPEFSHYLYLSFLLTGVIATVESSMMVIASLVPNFLMGVIVGAGYLYFELHQCSEDLRQKKDFGLFYPGDNEALFACTSLGRAAKRLKESDLVRDSSQAVYFNISHVTKGFMMMTVGFFQPLPDLPKLF